MYKQDRSNENGISKQEIIELIRTNQPLTIIELGASNGEDTAHLINKIGPNDKYYAIEVDHRNIERFIVKDSRLTLINAAIWNENKEDGVFHMCTGIIPQLDRPHYDGNTLKELHLDTFKDAPWMTFEDVKVPYMTLDKLSLQYNINIIDFIWCDVEGAIKEVIEGGLETFNRVRYFYTEISNEDGAYSFVDGIKYNDLISLMNNIGFDLLYKFKSDVLFKNRNLN